MTGPRCRYLRLNEQQCTAEAADPEADVLLCVKHLSRARTPSLAERRRRMEVLGERPDGARATA